MVNQDIIDNLTQHQRENQLKRDRFRAAAYSKAIQQIRSVPYEITDVSQVSGMPGIGAKIREKIQLVLEGRPKLATIEPIYEDLMKIPGVGPVKARDLVDVHHVKSIEDLRRKPGLLDAKQRVGLKYYKYAGLKIPRREMDGHHEFLRAIVNKMKLVGQSPEFARQRAGFESLEVEIAGSYRRGHYESSDIDVILTSTNPQMFGCFIQLLRDEGYIIDTLSQGGKMFMGYAQLSPDATLGKPAPSEATPRRIDIIYTTPAERPFALLYFSGPRKFNEEIRLEARRRGLLLNQHGLWHNTTRIPNLKTEREIVEYLGLRLPK